MRGSAAVFIISLAALAAACGSRPVPMESGPAATAASLDPVGTYDFTVSLGAETRSGMIEVQRTDGGYGGVGRLEGETESAVIDSVSVDGRRMIIYMTAPGESVTFEMDFTGASFTGFVFAGEDAVPLTGSKRSS